MLSMLFISLFVITFMLLILYVQKYREIQKKYELLRDKKFDGDALYFKSRYASMGETVGNIAHQWKQPLNAIGSIQNSIKAALLFRGEISKEKLLSSVETSFKLIQHLAETIDTFYSFLSQQNNKKMNFVVADELEKVRKITEYSFQNSKIFLQFDLEVNPTIAGNANEFTHAMLNIILNAKDAFDGSSVSSSEITVHVSESEERCVISICDNAGGIRLDPIDMVFDLHISTKEAGSGLGLFMTKNIIENRFGGKISVANINHGACFTIELPYAENGERFHEITTLDEKITLERINKLSHKVIELEEVEKALKMWADIFKHARWGIAIYVEESQCFEMSNSAFESLYGYTSKEIKELSLSDFFTPETLPFFLVVQEEALKQGYAVLEAVHMRKDGTTFPVLIELIVVKDDKDKVLYIISNIWDLSQRKEIEENLLLKEFALNKISEAVYLIDKNANFQYVNESACKSLGYSEAELLGMGVPDIDSNVPLERFEKLWENMKKVRTVSFDTFHTRKDGTVFPVEINSNYFEYENRSYNLATVRDISERIEIEKRKEDEKMRLFFERQIIGMAITSPKEGWVQTNDKLCEILGYTHEELSQISWVEITHPEDRERDLEQFNKLLSGEIDDYTLEKRVTRKDKEMIYINLAVSCVRHEDGSVDYILALIEDITERKRAENAIRTLNETLENRVKKRTAELQNALDFNNGIINAIPDLMFEVNTKGTYLNVWAKDERLLAAQKEILLGNKINDVLSEEAAAVAMEAIQEADANGLSFGKILQIDLPDGAHWFELSSSKKADGNIIFISRDVTERKVAQMKIEEEREKFSSIFRLSPAGISISSLDRMVYVDVNESLLNYIGYTREEMIGRGTQELEIFQDPSARLELLRRLEKDGAVSDFEYSYRMKDGHVGQSMMYGTIIMLNGEKCFLAHNYDITERKKIETRFSKIAVAAPGVNYIFEKTFEGVFRFTYLAPTFEELSGVSNEVVLNDFTKSFEMIVPQDRHRVMQSIVSSAENLTILHMEFRIIHPQKGILWVESQSKPEKLPDGTIEWYGFLYYITNRKNDEQKLGLLNKAIDNASDAVYIVKDDHSIYYVSGGACRMLGYTKEEFLAMKIEDIDPLMSTEELSIVRDEVKKKQTLILQTKHRKKNGAIIDVEITGTEFHYDDFSLRLAIVKDISERKKHEDEIVQFSKTLEHKVRELQRAFELNEDIINTLPDLLFEMDESGNYLNIWAQNKELLAQQKEALLGNNIYNVLSKQAADTIIEAFKEANISKLSTGKHIQIDLPEGKKHFELSVSKKSDGNYLILSREVLGR